MWLTWMMVFSFTLFKKVPNYVQFIPHFKTPKQAHYQHLSICICISSEKQNSKSFQATSVLLGSNKHWQLGEMKIPLSSPSKLTQEVTRGLLKLPCYTDHNLDRERPPLKMRQFRFLTGSLLTIPQNSQPQTTKTLTKENFAVWVISALLTQPNSPFLQNKDQSRA